METIRTHTGDGTQTIFNIDFDMGYLRKSHIYVYQGAPSEYQNQLDYTWLSDSQIVMAVAPPIDMVFNIRRVVDREQLVNSYSDGALLHKDNLNDSFEQALMILEEVEDGFVFSPEENIKGMLRIASDELATDANTIIPTLAERVAAFFIWDANGDIIAIKVVDLLDYIGGTKIGAGEGLYDTYDAPNNLTVLHVGAGAGLEVTADAVALDATQLAISADVVHSGIGNDNALSTADLNTIVRSGMYYVAAGAPNNPNSEDGTLLVIAGVGGNTSQIFCELNDDGTQGAVNVYFRSQYNTVWNTDSPLNGWQVLVTTSNVQAILTATYISFTDDGIQAPQYTNLQDAVAAALTAIGTRYNPASTVLTATTVQVAIEQVVSVLEFITSGVQFEGVWNATTNMPPIDTYTPNSGDFYIVSVAGTTDISGGVPDPAGDPLNNWQVADVVIYDAVAGDNLYIGWNRRPDAGRITNASTVVFNPVNYSAYFPTDATPPLTSQAAHDVVWPFASQTLLSNVGRSLLANMTDYSALKAAQFNTSITSTIGHPSATAEEVSVISGVGAILDSFGFMAVTASGTPRAFFNNRQNGVDNTWLEAFLTTRTGAEVEAILDASVAHVADVTTNPHNITPALIGAPTVGDLSAYVPFTGGTMLGDLIASNALALNANLLLASTSLQAGDNVSALVNDAGYLTSAPAAPVASVDGRTGVVTLGDLYATTAQGVKADSALQSVPVATSTTFGGFKYTFTGGVLNLITV